MKGKVIMVEINSYLSFHFLGCDRKSRKLFLALPREKSDSTEWTAGNIYDEDLNTVGSWYDLFPLNFLEEQFTMMNDAVSNFRAFVTDTWLTDEEIIKLMFLHGKFYFQRLQLGYIQTLDDEEFSSLFATMINPYEIVQEINQLFENKIELWGVL